MNKFFPFIKKFPGWNPWQYLNTFKKLNDPSVTTSKQTGDIVPFAKLPNVLLPASKIWGQAIGYNCNLKLFKRLYKYYLGSQKFFPPTIGYCIGDIYKENVYVYMYLGFSDPPYSSFNSDIFQRSRLKRIYISEGKVSSFTKDKDSSGNDIGLLSIDYSEKIPPSVLTKINILAASSSLGQIRIYKNKSDGLLHEYILNIKNIRDNWVFEVSLPPDEPDSNGVLVPVQFGPTEYYHILNTSTTSNSAIDKIYCVEDPLMMSGQWWGKDSEKSTTSPLLSVTTMPDTSLGLHITEHNKPYDNVAFTGAYIWKNNVNSVNTTTLISSQSPLDSSIGGEWFWIPFSDPPTPNDTEQYPTGSTVGNENKKFYLNDERFKYQYVSNTFSSISNVLASTTSSNVASNFSDITNTLIGLTGGLSNVYAESTTSKYITTGTTSSTNVFSSVTGTSTYFSEVGNVLSAVQPIEIPFQKGVTQDIVDWKNLWPLNKSGEKPYIRMELNRGGGAYYQNWHAPNLSKCWLRQNSENGILRYFRIIGQPDGNVIDVELKDETGTIDLDTSAFAHGSIFNQYAWILNEHYEGSEYRGAFQGRINSSVVSSGNTVVNITTKIVPTSGFGGTKVCGTLADTYLNMFSGVHEMWPSKYEPTYLWSPTSSSPVYEDQSMGINKHNCFYNRFRLNPTSELETPNKMIALYDKTYDWKLVVSNTSSTYNITNITFSNFPVNYDQEYQETIKISGENSLNIGDEAYITFDEPYKLSRVAVNNVLAETTTSSNILPPNGGALFATMEVLGGGTTIGEAISPGGITNIGEATGALGVLGTQLAAGPTVTQEPWTVCLNVDWRSYILLERIPKNTFVGVCGGRYLGFASRGSNFTFSEEGEDLLFTTSLTAQLGLSSLYNKYVQEDWVVYKDPYSSITTIRRGTLDYREQPKRSEISIGANAKSELIISSPYSITQTDKTLRLRKITFKSPFISPYGSENGQCIMASIKTINNIYGNIQAGKGEVDLQMLRKQGVSNGVVSATTYKFNEYLSSPVYVYKRNRGDSFVNENSIDVGVSTSDSPIYLIDVSNVSSTIGIPYVTNVRAEYVTHKQMLEQNTLFDIHKLEDGEEIVVYGYPVLKYTVNGISKDGSKWATPNAVFVIGNGAESAEWGCPLVKTLNYTKTLFPTGTAGIPTANDFVYPLMIVPCSDYLGSVYHYGFRRLFVFARGYTNGGSSFVGCYSISFDNLLYEAYKATTSPYLDFIYRPLSLPPSLFTNSNESPIPATSQSNIIMATTNTGNDRFFKAIDTEKGTNTVSPFIAKDGTLAILYDTDEGIHLAYSRNLSVFRESPVLIVNDVHSPLLIDYNILVFINSENGIGIKIAIDNNLYSAMKVGDMDTTAGNYQTTLESIKQEIDNVPIIYIGSGKIPDQKLTGYKTMSGIYKIFFYDDNGVVSCMASSNLRSWQFHPNF